MNNPTTRETVYRVLNQERNQQESQHEEGKCTEPILPLRDELYEMTRLISDAVFSYESNPEQTVDETLTNIRTIIVNGIRTLEHFGGSLVMVGKKSNETGH